MKKLLTGVLLALAMVASTVVGYAAPSAAYSGPYYATITGNGRVGPFPTYGQSVCGFTLSNGTGTLTATVGQSIDGQLFSTLGSPLTGLANGAQYSWSVLPNPPTSQALTSGAAGVSANQITVSAFTGTPMNLVFACTSSPLAVTPSSIGAVASVTSAGSPIFIGGSATNPTVGLTTPLTVPFGGTGVASPNPLASPPLGITGTWPNLTFSRTPDQSYSWSWDKGGLCDGSTDQKTAFNANASWPVSCPTGSGGLFLNQGTTVFPDGRTSGDSTKVIAVNSATNRIQARNTSTVTSPPTYNGTWASIQSAFDGDQSHIVLPFQVYTAPNAIATPGAGAYTISPMTAGVLGDCEMASGYQDPITRANRTEDACVKVAIKADPTAGGDIVAFNASASCGSTQVNFTWPGETACVLYNGQDNAAVDNVYLNPFELHMHDNGHDVSEVAAYMELMRNNGTAGNQNSWEGYTAGSTGSAAIDSFLRFSGPTFLGLDFVKATFTGCAICLPHDAGVYYNATNVGNTFSRYVTPGTTFTQYVAANTDLETTVAGTVGLKTAATGITAPNVTDSALTSGQCVKAGSSGILAGYTCPTNLIASTGPITIQTSATALAFVAASSCGTNAQGCSSGVITITTPAVAPPGATQYWVTATMTASAGAALTAETIMGCGTTSADVTLVDFQPASAANAVCVGGTTGTTGTKVLGTQQFNDLALAAPGIWGAGTSHFLVPVNTSVPLTCYFAGSTTTQVTVALNCSMTAIPVP